jgi:putative spermidine/putrescine transport system permease protein
VRKPWIWLLFPALAIIVVLFGGSLFFAVAESFGLLQETFTLSNFEKVIKNREIRVAFFFTLWVTTVSTVLSAALGTFLAVWLRRQLNESLLLKTLLQFPLAVPHLVVALIFLNLLAPSGIFGRVFYALGLINSPAEFPVLVNDAYGVGIILAYVIKETPFIVLVVLTVLVRVGNDFETVAANLGASKRQRFFYVTLPLVAPSIIFSSLIVWAFVFGAFEMPLVLGRTYPAMLSIAAQRKFNSTDLAERPEAMALAVLMTLATILFVWLYLRLTEKHSEIEKTTLF